MQIIVIAAFLCGVLAGPGNLGARLEARTLGQDKSESHSSPRPPSRWWKTDKYVQELKLTPEQSAAIEAIVQASMERLKADKDDLDRAQTDFRQLMERPNASERDLLKAAERLEMARFSISKERSTMLVRIHSVLTPDQRKGLHAIATRHEAERQRRR